MSQISKPGPLNESLLSISNYNYELPEERIAKFPLPDRDQSNLLIYKQGNISHDLFKNLSDHLPNRSLLVFNNSKVLNARLHFRKKSGGIVEIFCLEQPGHFPDIALALQQKGRISWHCLIGGASKWKRGQILSKETERSGEKIILSATYTGKSDDDFTIEFSWSPSSLSFGEVLQAAGAVPLPPYIHRDPEEWDKERYQTIFAESPGSVAAPTAGLHFTSSVLDSLQHKNISSAFITLHVGAGTFKPVTAASAAAHVMHGEWMDVSRQAIQHIVAGLQNKVIAVGTTSLRTVESLYWLGVKLLAGEADPFSSGLSQWEAYSDQHNYSAKQCLDALVSHMKKNNMDRLIARTQLMIVPGYRFRIVTGLITNFHLPGSSLLLLVAAFTGKHWRKIYDYALDNNFRFLSYGDGSLLWKDA